MIFVDTSALLAMLSSADLNHSRAMQCWRSLLEENQTFITSNYVLVEGIVLIQKRLGLSKVHDFQEKIMPLLAIEWMDEKQHSVAMQRMLSADRRQLSLVDCSSFDVIERMKIEKAFTFDSHFREQGFDVIP